MPFPSEYSLKSARDVSCRSAGSTSARFVDFIRSLFQPFSKRTETVYNFASPTTVAPCSSDSYSLKRHQTTPPIRSTSQYEHLSDARKNTYGSRSNTTLFSTQFVRPGSPRSPSPSTPPLHLCVCTTDQFYTPQIRRFSIKRTNTEAAGLDDIRIINLDEGMMHAHSHYRPEEKYVIRAESRPIYSESVEVDVFGAAPYQLPPLSRRLEKRIVSVANIAMDGSHANVVDTQPQPSNITEKKISLKRQNYDQEEQQNQVLDENESNRQTEIKERILTEWERRWQRDEQGMDSSLSSPTTREEPMMVDDELKEIPSPNLRQYCSSPDGFNGLKNSDWEVDHSARWTEENSANFYEGRSQGEYVHPSSVASYLANRSQKYNQEIGNYSSNSQHWESDKRLHSVVILPVPDEETEADYEFLQVKEPLPLCPQSVPLTGKSLGVLIEQF
ncbi:hypothetical protein TcWFU_010149 [Taenia crassiceps]|uniref:Uncharacterized protein n=1 Tax=Taenia crassiceps TaxID=6207 RepID=A0ABR4QMY9_9CEST